MTWEWIVPAGQWDDSAILAVALTDNPKICYSKGVNTKIRDSNRGAHAPEDSMEAHVRRVQVHLVTKDEMPRWMDPMARHHY